MRRCNLCLKRARMTADHVFPKSITPPGQRQVTQTLKTLKAHYKIRPKSRLVQNGVVRLTLCANCNNNILGQLLDPSLTRAYREATFQLRNVKFLMQPVITLENIELNKVARAVTAHFIANDEAPQARHRFIRKLRRYILTPEANFPEGYQFQLWLYPFREQAILKDLYHAQFGKSFSPFGISSYKTYPLAFSFGEKNQNPDFNIPGIIDLTSHLGTDIHKLYNLRIDTRITVDPNWPYAPLKDGAILTSENDSIATKPLMNVKKYPY